MTELKRTGSTRAVVPASIRNGRRNRNVTAAIAGTVIVAFAAVGLAQPFLAAANGTAAIAPHTPSLAQISAAQTQSYQADAAPVTKKDNKKPATVTLARGGDVEADLKPEPKPAPQSVEDASAGAPSYPQGGSYDVGTVQAMAQEVLAANGQADQWGCFEAIIGQESGWDPYAMNSSSGAYGIPQALPGEKMASAGADWQTNPATQVKWALGYMNGRYGSPCGAYDFKFTQGNGWY
ncbi:transglycosylase SLT domain-containing protein [Gulosibacter bifidus]|uniref:Transglycosylase SLT domain-containing protein n=1 Tax=Gulosibacter bifidus TaxID=272239 RepID=A0ABW5RL72_9MICO|nr:transglycosylase SLT domain-containing protein [Gulosibacter bifidus]